MSSSLIERLRKLVGLRDSAGVYPQFVPTADMILEAASLIEELLGALEECANDLESEVRDRWGYDERLSHKLERDLAPVVQARTIIAKVRSGE